MATIIELKAKIKDLSSNQRYLKDQSKSKFNKFERKVSYLEAQYYHRTRRAELRLLYITLGLLRGKTLKEMEEIYSPLDHYDNLKVTKLHFEYSEEVVYTNK